MDEDSDDEVDEKYCVIYFIQKINVLILVFDVIDIDDT